MNESDISRILRAQAWERAKGELQSMLCAFHGAQDANPDQFEKLNQLVDDFVTKVEDDGLHQ